MNIVIRTDASSQIGTGHLMRCLTLAESLRGEGSQVSFICRELPGNLCDLVQRKKFIVERLPPVGVQFNNNSRAKHAIQGLDVSSEVDANQTKAVLLKKKQDIDWLIVDHYALDFSWEQQMRPSVKRIMVIDDLANRSHDCDLLLDQNFYQDLEARYDALVPKHCQKLLGPKYALLRAEFRQTRQTLRIRDGSVRRILVSFGGSDPTNETAKALKAIRLLNRSDIAVDIVVGASNPHQEQLKQLCASSPNTMFYCQVENMAQLMANTDLAVAAGGTTTWERCFLGLPTITLVIAQNQLETSAAVAAVGATWYLGWCSDITVQDLGNAIKKALETPSVLRQMAENCMKLMDTHLTAEGSDRVVNALMELTNAQA